jgi:putative pyruvate formate lyase activating enzyme
MHFLDPGLEHLELIQRLNPGFRLKMNWPPHDFVPNLARTRNLRTGLSRSTLTEMDSELVWEMHRQAVRGMVSTRDDHSASLLDIKVELARRELLDCGLCGHLCRVNRFLTPGKCGLKSNAFVVPPFLHIGEEPVITPAATLKLFQCALNCQGCQSWEIIHQKEAVLLKEALVLDQTIWSKCSDFWKAAAIEFVGGNPDESIYTILSALTALPPELTSKPIVWNTHGYGTPVVYELLNGVVDIYIPDFKGCDACVERISRVKGYWGYVTSGVEAMLRQKARVIVRVLVLPGHVACCHRPALEWLAQHRDRLWMSLMQFVPDYRALESTDLNRPTSEAEMTEVRSIMSRLKLRDVEQEPEKFWSN